MEKTNQAHYLLSSPSLLSAIISERNKGTDVIRILSDCSVDGTMYPFRHVAKVSRLVSFLRPEGVVGGDVVDVDMTCTMDCDSRL